MLQFVKFFTASKSKDVFGIVVSILCAIHCAVLPLLLSLSTMASLHFLSNPLIEYSIITLSLFLALFSFLPAFKQHHRQFLPLFLLGLGFALIGLGQSRLFLLNEAILTVSGASVIAISHAVNWQLMIKSKKISIKA